MENNDGTRNALHRYSDALGLKPYEKDTDTRDYDMSWRLKLADIVVKRDGKEMVVDLGSQCGGMTHALKEAGAKKVVSTEHLRSYCKDYVRKVNDDVVLCDSFRLPIRNADALVSYMFLGQNMGQNRHYRLGNPEGLKAIFEKLAGSAGTVYSVERQSEYSRLFDPNWFDPKARTLFEPEEIEKKLKEALSPDFEVEGLGGFGLYRGSPIDVEIRLGFKFTRKKPESRNSKKIF